MKYKQQMLKNLQSKLIKKRVRIQNFIVPQRILVNVHFPKSAFLGPTKTNTLNNCY